MHIIGQICGDTCPGMHTALTFFYKYAQTVIFILFAPLPPFLSLSFLHMHTHAHTHTHTAHEHINTCAPVNERHTYTPQHTRTQPLTDIPVQTQRNTRRHCHTQDVHLARAPAI